MHRRSRYAGSLLLMILSCLLLVAPLAQAASGADGDLPGPSPAANNLAAATDSTSIAVTWGTNSYGALGDGTWTSRPLATAVDATGALAGKNVTAVDTGGQQGNTCAVASGAAYCWGSGSGGILGTGSNVSSLTPAAVNATGALAGKTVTAISVGGFHVCAIASGKAYCWGDNYYGQLGNGSNVDSSLPVAVATNGVLAGKTVTSISTRYNHTCAVADARAYCWGYNYYGQLGIGLTTNSSTPVAVNTVGALAGKNVTGIATGSSHSCAVAGGTVACWGANNNYELGNNTNVTSYVPVAVVGITGTATAIAAGQISNCAIVADAVSCWGYRYTRIAAPIAPGLMKGKVTAVAVGSMHGCGLADAKVYCWGNYTRIGEGLTVSRETPVAVNTASSLAGRKVIGLDVSSDMTAVVTGPVAFPDVAATSDFYAEIVWIATNGITGGYSDGRFQPANSVSRQAIAAFLWRAANPGVPDRTCTGTARIYTDVAKANIFCGSIEWIAGRGLTAGLANTAFRPNDVASREFIAALIWRLQHPGLPDPTCSGGARKFTDVPATNPLCGIIETLADAKVINGYNDKTYRPTGNVSRQATAAFFERSFG